MYHLITICFFIPLSLFALKIEQTPIEFSHTRVQLTKEYIKSHYGLHVKDIKIVPKIVVVHHTAIDDFAGSLSRFTSQTLPSDRPEIQNAGAVNVSAHFMVERDGTVHQLMPLDYMARHVIGLNYNSIGIENVGGENSKDNLTAKQLASNVELIKELKQKFETIEYVIGHYEYRCFEKTELWLESDKNYRTFKDDPAPRFMNDLRSKLAGFKTAPCKSTDD